TSDNSSSKNIDNPESSAETIKDLYGQTNQLHETLTILADEIQTLIKDSTRLTSESIQVKSFVEEYRHEQLKVQNSEEDHGALLNGIRINQEMIQQNLNDLTQSIENLEYTSYDGTFIWKVNNVGERIADAQSERQPSVYSPPFYSSRTGYKMCMRLYLNGDGHARRTHVSLFFVLMRGEYDSILKWPFHFKVTFCLFDTSGQQRHIINSFRPDVSSNSCQIPKTMMNIAFGIPKFFPLSMLQQDKNNYVKDNSIFIKCIVHFDDIPKMVLPYVFSLSPGLPDHIQKAMIKAEIERRQQAAIIQLQ
ncbi:unnamed protein product, partial [Didymodactylos carnosus]